MTKKKENQRLTPAELEHLADLYRIAMLTIRELEAEARPIKEAIVSACRARGLADTLELQALTVVPQTRTTQTLDQQAVTPDWLYRFQSQGGRLSVKLDADANPTPDMAALLREVHYCETATQSYQLKLKP